MDRQSHYTYGELRDAVFKLLGDYSANGKRISVSLGGACDTELVFLQAFNMCLRRVCLSFPLLAKTVSCVFEAEASDAKGCIALPEDFFTVHSLTVDGKSMPSGCYSVQSGKLYCPNAAVGQTATIVYASMPKAFDKNTLADEPIGLPDVTCDALIYLTASELCPSEESDRYSRLIYGYRDIAYNVYNALPEKKSRNTFFESLAGLKQKIARTGR